jgi:histidine phosphotransferase ChpT
MPGGFPKAANHVNSSLMNDTHPALPRAAELSAMMSAKLCHDLISPTSAIVSGVDLIEDPESQDMREDAMSLIASSSRKLGAMLQFCRVAYGASASAQTFDIRDLKKLAEGYFEYQKAELEFPADPPSVSKPAARVLLNLAQLGASALPRGGNARLTAEETGGSVTVTLTATGLRAGLRGEVREGLEGRPMSEGLPGNWVQAYYLACIVADAGGSIACQTAEESVLVRVALPAEPSTA